MKENNILFSIIVPVYNTEKYIEKCLKSIVNAIDTDCEVIIINDGSTDNSEQVINKFIKNLPDKLKDNFIYKFKENKGLADTKNVGIEMAKGEYISVVDSDDCILEDFYTMARPYIKKEFDIIIYDLYIIFEKNYAENYCKQINSKEKLTFYNYIARAYRDDKEDFKSALLCGAMQGSSCNKIIRRSLYKPYKFPTNKEYEDTAVTPFILMDTNKIKYIPYPAYQYLQRAKSIVASNTYITAFYKICENISHELKDIKNYKKYNEIINEFFIERGLDVFYEDHKKNKKDFYKRLVNFSKDNENTIKYILDEDIIYNQKNHYSERQKMLLKTIYQNIYNKQYKGIGKLFISRKVVNYLRRIYRSFIHLLKTIAGKD